MMSRDSLENAGERTGLNRMMIRNYFVIFAISLRGHADMRTFLPGHIIAQDAKCLDQLRSINIARKLH